MGEEDKKQEREEERGTACSISMLGYVVVMYMADLQCITQ